MGECFYLSDFCHLNEENDCCDNHSGDCFPIFSDCKFQNADTCQSIYHDFCQLGGQDECCEIGTTVCFKLNRPCEGYQSEELCEKSENCLLESRDDRSECC